MTSDTSVNSDEQLMERAKHGDLDCIAVLFDRHHLGLYNFFFYQVKEESKSEDLTQNVFEKIIKHRVKYDSQKPFKSWLYKIAWNEYNDMFRKKKLVLPGEEKMQFMDHKDGTNEADQLDDQKQRLQIAMGQLSPDQQQLIQLTKFQGLRYHEVAEVLDSSVSNVKVKIHRTMKILKNNYFKIREI